MRLIRLKDQPIRVEGKYGVVIIDLSAHCMTVKTLPDTECQSRIRIKGVVESHDPEGHTIILEKR